MEVLGPFQVEIARTRVERRRGLRGRAGLDPSTGMLFPHARSIHTFGMRFTITVVFLDADHRVIEARRVPPSHVAWNLRARHVLEVDGAIRCRPGEAFSRADPGRRTTPDARGTGRRHRT